MYYWCNTAGERKWSNWGNRRWNFKHGNNWFEFMFMRKEWIVHNHQFTTKAKYRLNERKNTWHRVITSIERSVLQSLKTIYLHTSRTHQYSFLDISYKKLLLKEVAIVDNLKYFSHNFSGVTGLNQKIFWTNSHLHLLWNENLEVDVAKTRRRLESAQKHLTLHAWDITVSLCAVELMQNLCRYELHSQNQIKNFVLFD